MCLCITHIIGFERRKKGRKKKEEKGPRAKTSSISHVLAEQNKLASASLLLLLVFLTKKWKVAATALFIFLKSFQFKKETNKQKKRKGKKRKEKFECNTRREQCSRLGNGTSLFVTWKHLVVCVCVFVVVIVVVVVRREEEDRFFCFSFVFLSQSVWQWSIEPIGPWGQGSSSMNLVLHSGGVSSSSSSLYVRVTNQLTPLKTWKNTNCVSPRLLFLSLCF